MSRFCIKHPIFSRILRVSPIKEVVIATQSLDPRSELFSQCLTNWRAALGCSPNAGIFCGNPRFHDQNLPTRSCLFWCPHGWPEGKYTSLCSSRLGHRLHSDPHIANAIRNYVLAIKDHHWVLTANKTTLHEPLTRGCQLFQIPRIDLQPFPKRISASWLKHSLRSCQPHSIPIWFDPDATSGDELLFSLCDELRVLSIRPKGQIERLVDHFCARAAGPQIWSLVDGKVPGAAKKTPNRSQRIISWHLLPPQTGPLTEGLFNQRAGVQPAIKQLGDWQFEFLSHWTRSPPRRWPDQNQMSQFDPLFFSGTQSFSPLATLLRILTTRKLLSNGDLVSQKQRVICFTEVPLRDFPSRRIYRSHLSRWDFEPWGISIRKSTLTRLKARPVTYHSKNPKIPASPHYDRAVLRHSADWKMEREWRVMGDIDLNRIGRQDAVIFVPDVAAAKTLAPYSQWPFVIVDLARQNT